MQKKLLSLLMVATCSFVYSEEAPKASLKKEKVPVVSEAEHAQNKKTYDELTAKEKSLQEQLKKCQEERDKVEVNLHMHIQRKSYRDVSLEQCKGKKNAIKSHETNSKTHTNKIHSDAKQQDNGIERAWITGVTDPIKDSRADRVYSREDKRANDKNEIDTQLSQEHEEYSKVYHEKILPALAKSLQGKTVAIDTVYIPAFVACSHCRNNSDTYEKCLANRGVSKYASSETFVDAFIATGYDEAAEAARAEGIPFTLEEIKDSAQKNEITKEIAIKAKVAQENFKKAIKGELDPKPEGKKGTEGTSDQKTPTKNPPAPKPNIVPDKK